MLPKVHPLSRCVGHAPTRCPNVEETRNQMQNLSGRNPHIFSPPNGSGLFSFQNLSVLLPPYNNLQSRSALSGRPFFYIFFLPESASPCLRHTDASATGTLTLPSALRLFSKNAISILGGATTVLFKVCAKYLLPSLPFTRIFNLLACASPRFEQLPTSKYFFCLETMPQHRRTSLSDLPDRRNSTPGYEPGYPDF